MFGDSLDIVYAVSVTWLCRPINGLGEIFDLVNLTKEVLNLLPHFIYLLIFGNMVGKLVLDTHSMESVLTGEVVELSFEDGLVADVTHGVRVDDHMSVPLKPLMLPQNLCLSGMCHELLLERIDLELVINKTINEMLLHVSNLLIFWKQRQEVFYLEFGFLQEFQGI